MTWPGWFMWSLRHDAAFGVAWPKGKMAKRWRAGWPEEAEKLGEKLATRDRQKKPHICREHFVTISILVWSIVGGRFLGFSLRNAHGIL